MVHKIQVWIGKERPGDKSSESVICGIQFFYQDQLGKQFKGLQAVQKLPPGIPEYRTHLFELDPGDYIVAVHASQSLKSQRQLVQLDHLNQTTHLAFIRFITKMKRVYDIGKKDGRILKLDIPSHNRPICMRAHLKILYGTAYPKVSFLKATRAKPGSARAGMSFSMAARREG